MMCGKVVLALAGLGLCAIGCGSDKDSMEKRLATLQEDLIAVQNDNDRLSERLAALEMRQSRARPAAPAPASEAPAEPATLERPPLKVIKLAPGSQPAAPEPAAEAEAPDDGPRPVIRDLGSGRKSPRASRVGVRQTERSAEPSSGEL